MAVLQVRSFAVFATGKKTIHLEWEQKSTIFCFESFLPDSPPPSKLSRLCFLILLNVSRSITPAGSVAKRGLDLVSSPDDPHGGHTCRVADAPLESLVEKQTGFT